MGGEEEKPRQEADDSIRVICRIRPLNKSEEAAGSKFVCSFPSSRGQEDQMVSVGVSRALFFCLPHLYRTSSRPGWGGEGEGLRR